MVKATRPLLRSEFPTHPFPKKKKKKNMKPTCFVRGPKGMSRGLQGLFIIYVWVFILFLRHAGSFGRTRGVGIALRVRGRVVNKQWRGDVRTFRAHRKKYHM